MLLVYYSLVSAFFLFGSSVYAEGYNASSINLNSSEMADSEIDDTAGLFSSGISFGRFFTLVTFGIGLPVDTPIWFKILFSAWQTILTIFTVGFIIASIWNG